MTIAISSVHAGAQPESKPAKTQRRSYAGVLVAVEGVEGSGRSTQLHLLNRWLEIEGYRTYCAEWDPSPLVESATRRGKSSRWLTPITFSVIHAADFADRYERQILPLLRGGHIVLVDRYIYTALARDEARGCPAHWLRNLYKFAAVPDITFYFQTPLEMVMQRILGGRPRLTYYDAGMDLGLSLDRVESFRIFQGMIIERYEQLAATDNFVIMDGSLPPHQLQQQMRLIVSSKIDLKRFKTTEPTGVLVRPEPEIQEDNQERRETPTADETPTEPVRAQEIPKLVAEDEDPFFESAQEINGLIASRAYELFKSRGFAPGQEGEDWRRAESEIVLKVPIDITETETEVIIRAEVPGFTEKDVEIRVVSRALCVTGKRQEISEQKEGKTLYSERRASRIFRVLDLPSEIDPKGVTRTLGNGILEIKLLKAAMEKKVFVLTKAAAAAA